MSSRAWACHVNARVPLMARRVWDVLSSSPVSGAGDATRCATRAALVLRILRPGRPPWRPRLGLRVEVGVETAPTESFASTPTEPRRSGAVSRWAGPGSDSGVGVARVMSLGVWCLWPVNPTDSQCRGPRMCSLLLVREDVVKYHLPTHFPLEVAQAPDSVTSLVTWV